MSFGREEAGFEKRTWRHDDMRHVEDEANGRRDRFVGRWQAAYRTSSSLYVSVSEGDTGWKGRLHYLATAVGFAEILQEAGRHGGRTLLVQRESGFVARFRTVVLSFQAVDDGFNRGWGTLWRFPGIVNEA